MKTFFRSACLSLLAVLAGCDGGASGSSVQQAVTVTSCPAGLVPYDFYRFPNGLSDEALRRLGPDAGTGNSLISEKNYLILKTAKCTPNGGAERDVFETFKQNCDTKRVTCTWTEAAARLRLSPDKCGGNDIKVTYSCNEDQMERTAPDITRARCPSSPVQQVSCVPQNCYGQTRRNTALQCIPDLIKPVESKDAIKVNFDVVERPLQDPTRDTPDAYLVKSGVSTLTFDDNQMYHFQGSVDTTGAAPPRQLVTLWLKSRATKPGAAGGSLDLFRCFLGRIDLRKTEPKAVGAGWSVPFDETFRIPPECRDGVEFSNRVKTALLANGLSTDGVDAVTRAAATELVASYDLEGNAILTSGTVTVENTCSPNPLDFFFNYKNEVHNSFDYYSQTLVSVVHRRRSATATPAVEFNAVPNNLIAATSIEVPKLEYKVNKAGRARGSIDATVVVALSGPESAIWGRFLQTKTTNPPLFIDEFPKVQYESSRSVTSRGRKLQLSATNLFDFQHTFSGLLPIPDTNAKGADGLPLPDYGAFVAVDPNNLNLQFDGSLSETGAGATVKVRITNDVRKQLFAEGGRYPLVPGGTRNYVLQVCTQGKVTEDFDINLVAAYNLYVNGVYQGYKTQNYDYVKHVEVAPVDPKKMKSGEVLDPYAFLNVVDGSALTLKTARNNCARSAVFSFVGENIVTPLPEVEVGDGDASDLSPTSSGDPSRLEGTFNNDSTQDCVGNRCETTVEQSLGGTDAPIRSTVMSIVNEEDEEDTTEQFSTSFKVFGFDVLEAAKSGSVGPVESVFTISPNYEAIAKAFNKPFPAFKIEEGRVAAGVNGLSVGFEYKIPVHYGPLQGDLIFGVGAGAGISIEVSHKYNPKVASSCAAIVADGGVLPDGCPDPMLAMPALDFVRARNLCYALGGRLAEPRNDTDVSEMRKKVPSSTEMWVGAQVGNEYNPAYPCAEAWNPLFCGANHKIYLRWLSDAENFRRSVTFAPFENFGTSPVSQFFGLPITTDSPLPSRPVASGVTLTGNTFRMRPMDGAYPSVCKRPLITKGNSHEIGIKLNLAVGAGFSVAFCVPSDEIGVCLEGAMNIIEAKLTPGVSLTMTRVSNNAGASASQTKFGAKVDWSVNLLSGALEIKAVSPFGSVSYTLLDYEGFKQGEGTLTEFEYDFKNFPVGF